MSLLHEAPLMNIEHRQQLRDHRGNDGNDARDACDRNHAGVARHLHYGRPSIDGVQLSPEQGAQREP